MSKQTETQGPTGGSWQAVFHESGGYDCMTGAWDIQSERGKCLATVDQSDYGQEHCDYSYRSDEAKANARLIAAAPDLLEALIHVRQHYADKRLTGHILRIMDAVINGSQ